jgi:S1-C subfamily serine protease
VRPAVVQITNEQLVVDQFNRPFSIPAGVGSGVIYDSQGHILTNSHVVEGARQLLVSLPDGRSFRGELIGSDAQTDLAVVQISAADLPVAPLGDSTQLQVGDWVVAIGNALGLAGGPTVTAGVVSALDRTVQEPRATGGPGPFLFDVIQTDAAINPGNSGGPLVNLAGEVIGINTMVASETETGVAAQGIGFAISMASAGPIATQLVATGRVTHAYLGVSFAGLNAAIAVQLGIEATQKGVVVSSVAAGSPGARAGLQTRDVITGFDGAPISTDSAFAEVLDGRKPGDTVTLNVLRRGQPLTLRVTLSEAR